jgi:hypothetical protein
VKVVPNADLDDDYAQVVIVAVHEPAAADYDQDCMWSEDDENWVDAWLKDHAQRRKEQSLKSRSPDIPVIDASKFSEPISALATTLTLKLEREAAKSMDSPIPVDAAVILRQLTHTYNLIRFINSDQTKFDNVWYRQPYSFAALPLVRTMIDGLYNCTAMLDDPSRSSTFRISGYFRLREALREDEAKASTDPRIQEWVSARRWALEKGMKVDRISDADLDNRDNQWPLLGAYLRSKPDSPHKQFLRQLTLGFWKEYSSISHASYDALVNMFPFFTSDIQTRETRLEVEDAGERYAGAHFARAAGILLCLLTEIQHYFKFNDANIDERLDQIWTAMLPVEEVRELYDSRFKMMLRRPSPSTSK